MHYVKGDVSFNEGNTSFNKSRAVSPFHVLSLGPAFIYLYKRLILNSGSSQSLFRAESCRCGWPLTPAKGLHPYRRLSHMVTRRKQKETACAMQVKVFEEILFLL